MSGLLRYTQKLFGINAGTNQMSKYGSRIASPPGERYDGATITPALVQALSAFQGGQFAAMAGAKSPFVEDHNSLFYLAFYQLSYLLTRGIPEWDSGTIYNTNDFCKVGNVIYYSLIDNNTNNNPNSAIGFKWEYYLLAPTQQIFTNGSGNYTPTISTKLPIYLEVLMWGPGGGGSGSGTAPAGGDGTDGGDTVFGTFVAAGGKGAINVAGGAPGAGAGNSQNGCLGGSLIVNVNGTLIETTIPGGNGGSSEYRGLGGTGDSIPGNLFGVTGKLGGGGGSGGGIKASSGSPANFVALAGHGGGAGEFRREILPYPSSTPISWSCGNPGIGGANGGGGYSGGGGGGPLIIVNEYYQ